MKSSYKIALYGIALTTLGFTASAAELSSTTETSSIEVRQSTTETSLVEEETTVESSSVKVEASTEISEESTETSTETYEKELVEYEKSKQQKEATQIKKAKTSLKEQVDAYNKLDAKTYTAKTWNDFEKAYTKSEEVLKSEDADLVSILQSSEELATAHYQLISLKALQEELKQNKKLKSEDFTDISWEYFESAQEEANTFLEKTKDIDYETTEQEVLDHHSNIISYKNQLISSDEEQGSAEEPVAVEPEMPVDEENEDTSDTDDTTESTETSDEKIASEPESSTSTSESASFSTEESSAPQVSESKDSDKQSVVTKSTNKKEKEHYPVNSKPKYPVTENEPKTPVPASKPLPQTGEVIQNYAWIGILIVVGAVGAIAVQRRLKNK